jgi:hypothetical protein
LIKKQRQNISCDCTVKIILGAEPNRNADRFLGTAPGPRYQDKQEFLQVGTI